MQKDNWHMWYLIGGSNLQIISEYTAWSYDRHQENKTEKKTISGIGEMYRINREIEVLNWSAQENGKGQLLR